MSFTELVSKCSSSGNKRPIPEQRTAAERNGAAQTGKYRRRRSASTSSGIAPSTGLSRNPSSAGQYFFMRLMIVSLLIFNGGRPVSTEFVALSDDNHGPVLTMTDSCCLTETVALLNT
jgi:hypothetical protein